MNTGRIILLNLIHTKLLKKRLGLLPKSSYSTGKKSPEVQVKSEIPFDDDEYKCRVCLKEGSIPIFGNNTSEDFSVIFTSITNIEVFQDDHYPKFLCDSCRSLLQGALILKKTAEQSDIILKKDVPLSCSDGDEVYDDNEHDMDIQLTKPAVTEPAEPTKPTHPTEMRYHCGVCNLHFNTLTGIYNHRKTPEHKNAKYKCSMCNKVYNIKNYRKHIASHVSNYMCDICGKQFPVKSRLFRHKMTHGYELPFQCQACPYRGRFKESLKLHMRCHTGERPYQCPHCPVTCSRKGNLSRHLLCHKKEFNFHCDTCGKGYHFKRELEDHFKVDHVGIKDYPCHMCGKAFGTRKLMMKHQRRVHKREKLKCGRMPLYLIAQNIDD